MTKSGKHLLLIINPGSTSTKFAVYENETPLFEKTIRHPAGEFDGCPSVLDQKDIRARYILEAMAENNVKVEDLSAIVGRGGLIRPLDSGTYEVNDRMLEDLGKGSAASHASSLGGLIAADLGRKNKIPAYVVDPVVVDEREPKAKYSGIPGVDRNSVFHALNTKAVARIVAEQIGLEYEEARLVVAHMGGGITVGAHRYGRVIDVNDGLNGEGPFTPERCGGVAVASVVDMCFSGRYSKEDMLAFCHKRGGLLAYLGTNDLRVVEKRVNDGDLEASMIYEAMAYQIGKEIGGMVAVLEGRVDAIILTGGLAYSARFTGLIKQMVDPLAQVITYPGEDEMTALASGALRVLEGRAKAAEY